MTRELHGTTVTDEAEAIETECVEPMGVVHTSVLVEQHRLTVQVDGIPGDDFDCVAIARLHAEAWARQHGMAIPAENFDVIAIGGELVGVAWETVVGRGDIDLDQREPGAKDDWTYSARAAWWRDVLEAVFSRVKVTPKIRTGGVGMTTSDQSAKVIPLRSRSPFSGPAFVDPDNRPHESPCVCTRDMRTGEVVDYDCQPNQADYDGEPMPPFFGGPSAAD